MKENKGFWKRHLSDMFLLVLIILLFIPQVRKPIQVGLNRLFASSPTALTQPEREVLTEYEWKLNKLKGGTINFRKVEGKVLVLNFWATWCPPCIAEMPSFQSLYESYGEQVEFFFVSQEEEEKLERFLLKNNYELPVYRSVTRIPERLISSNLPTTYVISKSGEIVIEKTGVADWNSKKVRNLLDELLAEE